MHFQISKTCSPRLFRMLAIANITLLFHWLVLAFGLEQFNFFETSPTELSNTPHSDNPLSVSIVVENHPNHTPPQAMRPSKHSNNSTGHTNPKPSPFTDTSEVSNKQNTDVQSVNSPFPSDQAPQKPVPQTTVEATTQAQNNNTSPTVKTTNPPEQQSIDQPKNLELLFHVYLGDAEGNAVAQVVHAIQTYENHYEISSTGQALGLLANLYGGLLNQKSIGKIGADGIQPQLYTEQRGKKPETRVTIDRNNGQVLFGANQTGPEIIPNLQDRLSVIYRLGRDIENFMALGGSINKGQQWQYPVVSSSTMETFVFEAIKPETLKLADSNQVQTWHIKRMETTGHEKMSIDLWLDPALAWLPVQIRFTDKKGMVITQQQVRSGNAIRKD